MSQPKHIYIIDDKVDPLEPLVSKIIAYHIDNKSDIQMHLLAIVHTEDKGETKTKCKNLKENLIAKGINGSLFTCDVIDYNGDLDSFYDKGVDKKIFKKIKSKINKTPFSIALDLMLLDRRDVNRIRAGERILSHEISNEFGERIATYSTIEERASGLDYSIWKKVLCRDDLEIKFSATGKRHDAEYSEFARILYELAK